MNMNIKIHVMSRNPPAATVTSGQMSPRPVVGGGSSPRQVGGGSSPRQVGGGSSPRQGGSSASPRHPAGCSSRPRAATAVSGHTSPRSPGGHASPKAGCSSQEQYNITSDLISLISCLRKTIKKTFVF